MKTEILKTNPVQRLALHVAEMSGIEFLEKRNEKQISELYANARRYLRYKNRDTGNLFSLMYRDSYDCMGICRIENFGEILHANILNYYK